MLSVKFLKIRTFQAANYFFSIYFTPMLAISGLYCLPKSLASWTNENKVRMITCTTRVLPALQWNWIKYGFSPMEERQKKRNERIKQIIACFFKAKKVVDDCQSTSLLQAHTWPFCYLDGESLAPALNVTKWSVMSFCVCKWKSNLDVNLLRLTLQMPVTEMHCIFYATSSAHLLMKDKCQLPSRKALF